MRNVSTRLGSLAAENQGELVLSVLPSPSLELICRSNVPEADLRDALNDVYRRLKRLEDYCDINLNDGGPRHPWDPASDPADDALSHAESQPSASRILEMIMDPATRAQLFSNVFCHLRNAESRFFGNEKCIEAMGAVVKDVEHLFSTQVDESPASPPIISKEMARKWIQSTFSTNCEQSLFTDRLASVL